MFRATVDVVLHTPTPEIYLDDPGELNVLLMGLDTEDGPERWLVGDVVSIEAPSEVEYMEG